ncbi:hypothetical protein GQ43DRAFT_107136 [Delitschia confertaspora ATCC 74209]|uniref:Uncharacterized protein n=1 Tax=Delitschia confertaspora ATCC 74209 TaxID=1513339 RepID=A0A9P4JI80_9PLEO|nr:hypothetical protein GQ43DRAFT_107136 [Delitschia confertaspora ATCC 74209]
MAVDMSPESLVNDVSLQMAASQLSRQPSRASAGLSAHRPSRIQKPKSNHNSPRALERRKTTSGTKQYATLDDHYKMMYGSFESQEEVVPDHPVPSRPLSWHPSSAQFHVPPGLSANAPNSSAPSYTSARNSAYGSDFYSLSPRNSLHPDQVISQFPQSKVIIGSRSSESSFQEPSQQTSRHSYAASSYSPHSPDPWYLQEWQRKTQAQSACPERGGLSYFLPIQHPSAEVYQESTMQDDDAEEPGKELVALGLYDQPEDTLGWGSSSLLEGTGKGLKLEETWQPPEDMEDEDDEDQATSEDGSVEELPSKAYNQQQPIQPKIQPSPNMDGQSFFFDEDDTCTKEWWYQQLKQPTVQATGLGYGWI